MSLASNRFLLPDLLASCPLEGGVNPHYEKGAAESRAWINSYNVFTDRKRAFFVLGSNELLVSHAYNYASHEQFRTCCDFVSFTSGYFDSLLIVLWPIGECPLCLRRIERRSEWQGCSLHRKHIPQRHERLYLGRWLRILPDDQRVRLHSIHLSSRIHYRVLGSVHGFSAYRAQEQPPAS